MTDSISADEYKALAKPKRTENTKFNSKRVEIDGIKFGSKAEAARWFELVRWQALGLIEGLVRQPRFDLHTNGIKIGVYVADAMYWDNEKQQKVVEDTKGYWSKTPLYNWKKRHMKAEFGIEILEVKA